MLTIRRKLKRALYFKEAGAPELEDDIMAGPETNQMLVMAYGRILVNGLENLIAGWK